MPRILITGSRSWTDVELLRMLLLDYSQPGDVLVSGHCPDGADAIAEHLWAEAYGYPAEAHPADWARYGRAAGPMRNLEMIQLGADLCLAFITPCSSARCRNPAPHFSHGATHCADAAERAGIWTLRFYA